MSVDRTNEILVAGYCLPMQTAAKCLIFLLQLVQMFVELDRIERNSALLACEFSQLQGIFLSNHRYDDLKGNISIMEAFRQI